MSRDAEKRAFLSGTDWAGAELRPLAGDASLRSYQRLHRADGSTAVLMDAPPGSGEDIRPFCAMARHLTALGLSAPALLKEDAEAGLLLLEDLGDALYARVIAEDPALAAPLYDAAAEALRVLHAAPPPEGLAAYDTGIMTQMSVLAYTWYQAGATGQGVRNLPFFVTTLQPLLATLETEPPVVILRDYHAENLLWLPDRDGAARTGLLDFQDAMLGHPAYDLVSMLQDARRDVDPALEDAMVPRFAAATGRDPDTFRRAYDLLGVQRNLRILGVFARLSMHYGRPRYVDFIPRVWGLLCRSLDRPGLEPLRERLLTDLPEPTPEILQTLRDKCATVPQP